MMRDYKAYKLNGKEYLLCILISLGAAEVISWLFYRSPYGMAGAFPLFFLIRKVLKNYLHKKRRREMLFQFREILQFTSSALKAGNSMEHAVCQGVQEYVGLYGRKNVMAVEFINITHQLKLNVPLEQLMEDLAKRSGSQEITSFVHVFVYARRSGGDMMKIFQDTVEKIRQKSEVEREIHTVLAAKRTEQRIMDLVPFGILLYVGAASPEFLAPLYGNLLGAAVMTACLMGYAAAFWLAEKIMDIEV